jgi:hypothetical protein
MGLLGAPRGLEAEVPGAEWLPGPVTLIHEGIVVLLVTVI